MKKLQTKPRLQGLSIPEIHSPWLDVVRRIGRMMGGEYYSLAEGRFLNALVLRFTRMSADEQDRIAKLALAELDLILSETDEEIAGARVRLKEVREWLLTLGPPAEVERREGNPEPLLLPEPEPKSKGKRKQGAR